MREHFVYALERVLEHEGGYVDHPKDPGGATMKGITLTTYQRYYGQEKTKADLRAIPDGHVAHIYRDGYWNRCRCDDLPSGVDYVVFDQAVNAGPVQSIRWLQQALRVSADGIFGPATMRALQGRNPVIIIPEMCRIRLSFLERLRNGTLWKTFGKGWKRRVETVQVLGMRLANPDSDIRKSLAEWDRDH